MMTYTHTYTYLIYHQINKSLLNSQLPNCNGHLCVSIGKSSRFIGQPALIVSLKQGIENSTKLYRINIYNMFQHFSLWKQCNLSPNSLNIFWRFFWRFSSKLSDFQFIINFKSLLMPEYWKNNTFLY